MVSERYIKLSSGQYTVVDADDYADLSKSKWHVFTSPERNTSYAQSRRNSKTVRMHRLVTNAGRGQHVDHINRDGLDNRKSNLRLATRSQNQANSTKQKNNKSGYKGVHADGKKWRARLRHNGVNYYLGLFKNPVDAAKAYDAKAFELSGAFALLNAD